MVHGTTCLLFGTHFGHRTSPWRRRVAEPGGTGRRCGGGPGPGRRPRRLDRRNARVLRLALPSGENRQGSSVKSHMD